jgi:hypothetical protein
VESTRKYWLEQVSAKFGRAKADFVERACAQFDYGRPTLLNQCIPNVGDGMERGCINGLDTYREVRMYFERERRDGRIDFTCD